MTGADREVDALMAVMHTFILRRLGRRKTLRVAARPAAGAYACFAGLNAQAADLSNVAPAFGNTVVSTYPDGSSQKIWLHPDGSWDGLSRRGVPLAGHWSLHDDKVCFRQAKPPTLPISYCTPLPAGSGPGVQWTGRDVLGRPITLSLMKGIPPANQAETSAGRKPEAASGGQASAPQSPHGS